MSGSYFAGYIVNLLQDVNILRSLIYIAADNLNLKPTILITQGFTKRDSQAAWMKELHSMKSEINCILFNIESQYETWKLLNQFEGGFLISASESDLPAHEETHEIFKLAPAKISTVTLQHGFECVGFLMNKNHQQKWGNSVGFAAEYLCGWVPARLQRNLRPLHRSKYINLGPTAWIKKTNKRNLQPKITKNMSEPIGIVCENLHSIRYGKKHNVNQFMEQFFGLAEYLKAKGKKVALRPHPGGQYTIKNKIKLPENVILENRPSYAIRWSDYSYGISAPSSVLFDMLSNNVPALVWQDPCQSIDINQVSFLPIAQSTEEMIAFSNSPIYTAPSQFSQQLKYILRDNDQIAEDYTSFLDYLIRFSPDTRDATKKYEVIE
ncbi:hypothetical protein [Synechococcus sp. CC9605]|uniref:hypothetical protein n=1 Tax=Synechococcus sp. (strain CC9605) TaxID=110662 RepID=UPI00005D55F6|nr:hypothetical protein [Synechococcus sp. CC9605]ABB33922.1 hypothetical protein Syncc9605_0146 [Synechococcus sp. CC9605]